MSSRIDAYKDKLKTYLAPDYWRLVVSVHGVGGVPKEIARIVSPKKEQSASTALEHVDFSDRTTDPAQAMSHARERDVTAMIRVPMSSLRRNHLGVAIGDQATNPFARAVAGCLFGESTDYMRSILRRFYESWQPATLAQFVGVDTDGRTSELSRPLLVGALPWEPARSMQDLIHERDAYELDRLAKFGRAPGGRHGYDYFGPTSEALGEYRFNKHCNVARSIAESGYAPDDHIIDVQLLSGDGAWAVLVRDGKHRTTAMAALGVETVVVSLPEIYPEIRRQEVASWPGVVSGPYQVDEALQVFDRFIDGRPAYPSGLVESLGLSHTGDGVGPGVDGVA